MRFFLLLGIFLLSCGTVRAAETVPATSYFPLLPFDAPDNESPQLIPLASSHSLDESHAGITRAIIVIHDETRDAGAALNTIAALAGVMNSSTLIIAPQFLLPSDIVTFADHLPDRGKDFAAWQISGWDAGDNSMPVQTHKSVSSFTAIDLLLMYLSDRNAFPDLQTIVIAGYGAGANFTQRYAAFSLAADAIAKQNITLRFVVADTQSYIYQTPARVLGGRKGFGQPDATTCPDYNAYPYGLEKLNDYAKRGGTNAAKENYALHFITYLNAPASAPASEQICAVKLQGDNSAARAENYRAYLQSLYSDVASRTQNFVTLKNGPNNAVTLFGSPCGMAVLFGDGQCAAPVIVGNTP